MKIKLSSGFFGLLTILFIGLKLTNHIDWSWFWVLSPLIFSIFLFLFMLIIIVVIGNWVWFLKE
jgi:hypothetical protein